jgi:hypothetical protein
MRFSLPLAVVAALFTLTSSALAASAPASLPTVERSLSAAQAVKQSCVADRAGRAGAATTSWIAPMSGYVTTRLAASDRSDWDLTLFDAATGRRLASSQGFGSHEVAQTWVSSGQRVTAQGCRRKGSARSAKVSFKFFDVAPPKTGAAPQLLSVNIKGSEDLERLEALGLDVTHKITKGKADVVSYGEADLSLLKESGFTFATKIGDLAKHYVQNRLEDLAFGRRVGKSALPSGRTTYRTYEDYQAELKKIIEDPNNKGLVRKTVLPQKSVEGRELQGVEIAQNVNAEADGRPTFFLVATHHAREWPAAESAMEFAYTLVKGFHAGDSRVTDLLSRVRVVIVPLINVDGFVESRSSFDPGDELENAGAGPNDVQTVESIAPPGPFAYRRKNCRGSFPVGAPCAMQYGVDPNRNYGEGWGGNGASANPTGLTYRGSGPWSEPETQAVHEFSQRRQVTNIITLHNVAALVLRPPGRKADGLAPDEPRMKAIGKQMANATGYTNQFGWQLYDTSGTTEDWNYAAQGAYGYTIEIGPANGNFHMAYETGVVNEYNGSGKRAGKGLREALLIGAEAAANPADHAIIKGTAPAGRVLRLRKDFATKTSDVCQVALDEPAAPEVCEAKSGVIEVPDFLDTVTTVPASGEFVYHANPSTRPFVGARRERGELLDPKVEEYGPEPGEQTTPGALESDDGQPHHVDRPFTITEDEPTEAVTVELEWTGPEDYDLEVYRKDGDELVEVASSGQPPALPELAEFDAEPGEYLFRVVNYAATGNTWSATVSRAQRAPDKVTVGKTEAWTLSCESADGKTVYAKHQITVGRGETVNVENACADNAVVAPAVPTPGSGPTPNGGSNVNPGGVPTKPRGNTKGNRKAEAKRKKAKAKCLKKAKKIKKKAKRKKAVKRCNKKYRKRKKGSRRRS